MDQAETSAVDRAAHIQRQATAMMAHQGMTPSAEAIADAALFLSGQITRKELFARSDARVAAMPNSVASAP